MGARRDKRVREDVLFEGSSRIFQVGSLHNKHGYQSIHILGVGKYFNYKSLHDNIIAKICVCVFVCMCSSKVLFLVCLFLCLLQGEKQ